MGIYLRDIERIEIKNIKNTSYFSYTVDFSKVKYGKYDVFHYLKNHFLLLAPLANPMLIGKSL